jgi:hypothetical protein
MTFAHFPDRWGKSGKSGLGLLGLQTALLAALPLLWPLALPIGWGSADALLGRVATAAADVIDLASSLSVTRWGLTQTASRANGWPSLHFS